MNTETINTQLYEKMFAEQERYRDLPCFPAQCPCSLFRGFQIL